MTSTSKTKVLYGVKIRRGSQSSVWVDRTGIEVKEIPPELCHLTGDALATPFPHIAMGGYIRYYKLYSEPTHYDGPRAQHEVREVRDSDDLKEAKKRRRASSASTMLGPLLSHTPSPWPSKEVPSKSHLFHRRPQTSPSASSSSTQLSPLSKLRRSLAVIPETSKESIRVEVNLNNFHSGAATLPVSPKKRRVVSYPSTPPPTRSSLTETALLFTPPPRTSSLAISNSLRSDASFPISPPASPTGSLLRRRKRQLLRTPSVENDFAKSAIGILGLAHYDWTNRTISREPSSGSDRMTAESGVDQNVIGDSQGNTALASLFQPFSMFPTSNVDRGSDRSGGSIHEGPEAEHATEESPHVPHPPLISHAKSETSQSTESEELWERESNPSTPPTSVGCEFHEEVKMEFEEEEEQGPRDSWASYETAKSFIES